MSEHSLGGTTVGNGQYILNPQDICLQEKYWQLAILACRELAAGCYYGSDEQNIRLSKFEDHVYSGVSRQPVVSGVYARKRAPKPANTVAILYHGFCIELEKQTNWDEARFWLSETMGARFSKVAGTTAVIFFEAEVKKPRGTAASLMEDDLPHIRHYIALRDLYAGIERAIRRRKDKAFMQRGEIMMRRAREDEVAHFLGELLTTISGNGDASVIPISSGQ